MNWAAEQLGFVYCRECEAFYGAYSVGLEKHPLAPKQGLTTGKPIKEQHA